MPTIVQLPDHQTALLRDNEELSNRQVKELRRAARKVGLVGQKLKDLGFEMGTDKDEEPSEEDAAARNSKALEVFSHLSDDEDDALDLFQRTCVVVRLIEWTLDRPLPQTPADVDDLPRPVYATITTEAAKLDLNEDFSLDGATDPKAGTESSVGSEQPLQDANS